MAQLSVAYRAWSVPLEIDIGWAYWMRENLSVDGTKYSPELVHGWSPFRAAVIILFPVVLSLGVGVGICFQRGMSKLPGPSPRTLPQRLEVSNLSLVRLVIVVAFFIEYVADIS